jgi:hypothetical protein
LIWHGLALSVEVMGQATIHVCDVVKQEIHNWEFMDIGWNKPLSLAAWTKNWCAW